MSAAITLEVTVGGTRYRIDTKHGFDLSVPLRFDGAGAAAFGVEPARAHTLEYPGLLGDTARGGSCNVKSYRLIPHCHGTHTECVAHLVERAPSVSETLKDPWLPATVVSVPVQRARDCAERYRPAVRPGDGVVSKKCLLEAWTQFANPCFRPALVIRTLPNWPGKRVAGGPNPPYLSNDAMAAIVEAGVQHLLVDLPSVDRCHDEGRLSNHRLFWEMPPEGHDLAGVRAPSRTITELTRVPDAAADGYYFLNLQIAPFTADAAPSRPLIFAAEAV